MEDLLELTFVEMCGMHIFLVCVFFASDSQPSNMKHELSCQSGSSKKMPRWMGRDLLRKRE